MINFKKGPALSLHQVNYIGKAKNNEGVVAGMVVTINGDGQVVKPTIADSAADKDLLLGFAINNQSAGDVIESGVIGVYALDGASVIETDQTEPAVITPTDFPVGARLSVVTGTGKVCKVANTYAGQIIGQVEGIRSIPGTVQTLTDNNGNPYKVQLSTTVLAVKLSSGAAN
jgi:hypothetical protein